MAARAALHMWEEPVISGKNGSGAVFFSGCPLRCVFCQNHNIAIGKSGKEISMERLVEIFFELEEKGANNINLVTPTHFVPQIREAIIRAKKQGFRLPFVYNTGSYEKVETLKSLEGLIDIYLPDMKYYSAELANRYAKAPDYFEVAAAAVQEMFRQTGTPQFYREGNLSENVEYTGEEEDVLMRKGLILRHLILPGNTEDSKKVLDYAWHTYGNHIYFSIMNQYTPVGEQRFEELSRKKKMSQSLIMHWSLVWKTGLYRKGERQKKALFLNLIMKVFHEEASSGGIPGGVFFVKIRFYYRTKSSIIKV